MFSTKGPPWLNVVVVQLLSHIWLLTIPWTVAGQASLSFIISWRLLKLMYMRWYCPLLFLPSIFPSTRVFSIQSALRIRWPKYWSFSFSISPSREYSGLISFGIDWLISLQSKGLSRVFSSTTVQKHQFFGSQLSLWSNSHIHTWPLEKIIALTYGLLSAKWYLCFLICCLCLS